MLKNICLIGALTGFLFTSTAANAIPIVDIVDQNEYVGWLGSYEYTHDLLDNGFVPGTATSGNIEIQFSDDGGWFDSWETILIVVDDFDFDTGGVIYSASSFYNDLEINALAQINSVGSLDITIQSLWGDFYVGQSILTVETVAIAVPEPTILGLLGLGLFGLVMVRRIQKN